MPLERPWSLRSGMIRSMRRSTGTLLFLSVTAMLLAGCGSSTDASSISASVGADRPISRGQGVAYAHAVNLRAADIPGLQAGLRHVKRETTSGPFGAAIDRCESDTAHAGEIIGVISQSFTRSNARHHGGAFNDSLLPLESVHSGVYFFNSEALAHQYLAVADSARFAACVETVFSHEPKTVTREGSKVAEPMFSDPHVSTLPASTPGLRAYGLRLAAHSAIGDSESYQDYVSFVMGDAVITLNTTGIPHPFPTVTERRLLALLYRRAKAHKP